MKLTHIASDIYNFYNENIDFNAVENALDTLYILEGDLKNYLDKFHTRLPVSDLESLANILLTVKQLQRLLK